MSGTLQKINTIIQNPAICLDERILGYNSGTRISPGLGSPLENQ